MGAPYYRQLHDGMRRAILSGLLPSGTRLPSTRTPAAELGVSRTTVVTAFEASRHAADLGVEAPPVSFYGSVPGGRGGLMLGHAAVGGGEMPGAVRRLAKALG